jgi:RNA-directed DNA polymerase
MERSGGGTSVVVRARESRVHGEGRQSMSRAAKPPGKATYVVSKDDSLWLLNVQRKLYAQSQEQADYEFRKLWGLVTDIRNLRIALGRVNRNRGRRSAGVDGVTVRTVLVRGADDFLAQIRMDLRSGSFKPSPVRRVLIPKAGKLGKFRPLGIPTVTDRVVQAAVKNIMEPIFEADFFPVSYGFRPAKSVHGAIAHLKALLLPRRSRRWKLKETLPYQWVIEGDIKGCFDNIDHHGLMKRVRRRIGDRKLTRLVVAFLKAGVLSEDQFARSDSGTPQGGILSPLLANIALSAIEERYEWHAWPRRVKPRQSLPHGKPWRPLSDPDVIHKRAIRNRSYDKQRSRVVFMPIRYADDFIILVSMPPSPNGDDRGREVAEKEKAALAMHLQETLGLQLSEEKTLVTPVTSSIRFLGHHIKVRPHPSHGRLVSTALIPKDRSQRLRRKIKDHFARETLQMPLEDRLRQLNRMLRGWGNFYRHAWGAKRVFVAIDHHVWCWTRRWLRKKHPKANTRKLVRQYGWRKPRGRMVRWKDGSTRTVALASVPVAPYRMAWQKTPAFASTSMESPVHNEKCTPGLVRGTQKPRAETRG